MSNHKIILHAYTVYMYVLPLECMDSSLCIQYCHEPVLPSVIPGAK